MSSSPKRSLLSKVAARVASLPSLLKESEALQIPIWKMRGKPAPPPSRVKQRIVRSYLRASGLTTVVETGTYLGEMIRAVEPYAEKIYSVELDPKLHHGAVEKFRENGGVRILLGDSSELLPKISSEVPEPALFWLDAHYSGGLTARGDLDTPILRELEIVLGRQNLRDVVLIDDARLFIGRDDYPTIKELKDFVARVSPGTEVTVEMDIIRIVRPATRSRGPTT